MNYLLVGISVLWAAGIGGWNVVHAQPPIEDFLSSRGVEANMTVHPDLVNDVGEDLDPFDQAVSPDSAGAGEPIMVAARDRSRDQGSGVRRGIQSRHANRFYVFVADVGRIVPEPGVGPNEPLPGFEPLRAKMVLEKVHRKVEWYSDRPDRESGTISAPYFFERIWPSLFDEIAPNAVMNASPPGATDVTFGAFVTLGSQLSVTSTNDRQFEVVFPDFKFQAFAFVDPRNPSTVNQVKITVLHNTPPEAPYRWAFYHTGSTAHFQSLAGREYTLTIENVVRQVRDVTHAPGIESRSEALAAFIENWNTRFEDIPPNASLTTYLPGGRRGLREPEARILELLAPPQMVQQANGQVDVQYHTRVLHGAVDPAETLHAPALFIDSETKRMFNFKNYCDFDVWVGFNGSEASNESCTPRDPNSPPDPNAPPECPLGKQCVGPIGHTGKCECQTNAQCPQTGNGGQTCQAGKCICATNADCPGQQLCNTDTTPHTCYWALTGDRAKFKLDKNGGASSFDIPIPGSTPGNPPLPNAIVFSGAVWGRTACNDGLFCETADCKTNPCSAWVGPTTPHTRSEFTLKNDVDFYNTSLIHGFNVPFVMEPDPKGSYDLNPPNPGDPTDFICGNPGSPKPGTGAGPIPGWTKEKEFACKYEFEPTGTYADKFRFVTAGGDNCSSSADCTKKDENGKTEVCGLPFENVPGRAPYKHPATDQTTCGSLLGYWSADQICVVNKVYNFEPFNCPQTPENDDPILPFHTLANLYACEEGGGTCYAENATKSCCGCVDWEYNGSEIPTDIGCQNKTSLNTIPWTPQAHDDKLPFLKAACPMSYSYPFDDKSALHTCKTSNVPDTSLADMDRINYASYDFTFCPKDPDQNDKPLDGGVSLPTNQVMCDHKEKVVKDPVLGEVIIPTPTTWKVAPATEQSICLYEGDDLKHKKIYVPPEPGKDPMGVFVTFVPDVTKTYRADIIVSDDCPDTRPDKPSLAGCTLTYNTPTQCLVPDPEPTDTCSSWEIGRTGPPPSISAPFYK